MSGTQTAAMPPCSEEEQKECGPSASVWQKLASETVA